MPHWNYWAMITERHLFSATISHLDYAGLVFVYFADFATGQFSEVTRLLPLGRGCQLADVVVADAIYSGRGLQVAHHRPLRPPGPDLYPVLGASRDQQRLVGELRGSSAVWPLQWALHHH